MSAIDPRTLELIHAELDGELDASDRAELEQRLASEPEARIQHEQLRRMAGSLARLPQVEPPAGLRQRWHGDAGTAPRGAAPSIPAPVVSLRERHGARRWLRPAIGLAAGVLALAIGIRWSGIDGIGHDSRDLVGTLGGAPAGGSTQVVALDGAALQGSVALVPAPSGWNLEFRLDSQAPVSVEATYAPAALRLLGHEGGAGQALSMGPGKIAFASEGAQHLSLHLQPEQGGPIQVRLRGPDGESRELSLTLPPADPAN